MKRWVLSALLPALWAAAPVAAEPETGSYAPGEMALLRSVIELPHDRQAQVFDRLGVTPSQAFLDCLCRSAGYGGSGTGQYWHPDTIGTYNALYSCQHPGPPCVVSGYGCTRHPAPSAQAIWERCAAAHAEEGNLLDRVIEAARNRAPDAPDPDRLAALRQCRARYTAERDRMPDPFAGLQYLRDSKVPILPPPPHLMSRMQAQATEAQQIRASKLRALQKTASASAGKALGTELQDRIFSDANKKAALVTAAKLGLAYVAQQSQELAAHRDQIARQMKALEGPGTQDEYDRLKAIGWKLDAQRTQLDRDRSHLQKLAEGIEIGADVASLQGIYDSATSGDNRKLAGAVVSSAKLVQKYFERYSKAPLAERQKILDAAGDLMKGANAAEFASASVEAEILKGTSLVMAETIKAANNAIAIYDGYKAFETQMARVDRLASSGRYTEAQTQLLVAFDAMSALSARAAGYMPAGISDMMSYYAEAMKTPAVFDGMIRDFVNRADDGAQVTGDQANTPAMRAYRAEFGVERSLMRDQYLFRTAGLSAYEIDNSPEDRRYVFMPEADGAPLYVSAANYRKIAEYAYFFPIVHGRRMTDADVLEQFGAMGPRGTVNLDEMKRQVAEKLADAEQRAEAAAAYGQKTVTADEYLLWLRFRNDVTSRLPGLCRLDAGQMKKLFGGYRDAAQRETVLANVARYGDALRAAESGGEVGQ